MTEVPPETAGAPEQLPTIYELLPRVMALVGGVAKERQTQGTSSFRYRGIEDVLEKVQPALLEHSVTIVPHRVEVLADERYQARGGAQMRNVQVRTTFRAYGPRGDYVQVEALGEGSDAGDKATAKAESIAHKYALFQAFSIPTEDDPDKQTHEREPDPPPPPAWLEPLVARVMALGDDDKRALSEEGRRLNIGPSWQRAQDAQREELTRLVDEAEARAAERAATAAQEAQEGQERPEGEAGGPQPADAAPGPPEPPQPSPEDVAEAERLAKLGEEKF